VPDCLTRRDTFGPGPDQPGWLTNRGEAAKAGPPNGADNATYSGPWAGDGLFSDVFC